MSEYSLHMEIDDLKAENGKLRAEIDNLQATQPAPTIIDIIGPEAFDRMVELYPSFRESGTPTHPTDAASEVLWSAIRYLGRVEKLVDTQHEQVANITNEYDNVCAQYERATKALAEYAMRAVEEDEV